MKIRVRDDKTENQTETIFFINTTENQTETIFLLIRSVYMTAS